MGGRNFLIESTRAGLRFIEKLDGESHIAHGSSRPRDARPSPSAVLSLQLQFLR
jgi:hypothetical protein